MQEITVKHLKNVYSQNGEDGLIEEIFRRIGTSNKWCFEVGAGDGRWFSNVRNLIDQGWHAVLAEGDGKRFGELKKLENAQVKCQHAWVNDIDKMLEDAGAPAEPDLGVIDVDGQDYYLFLNMLRHRPRVMVVEYNPAADKEYIPERVSTDSQPSTKTLDQAGETAVVSVGVAKGYTAIFATTCNIVFVRNDCMIMMDAGDEVSDVTADDKPFEAKSPIRLNIGGGDTKIPEFINVDRRFGDEAYPLTVFHKPVADNSVDEIRACHILEHFDKATAPLALKDWVRALKPGGRIRISVPDIDKAMALRASGDAMWDRYVFGGQTDANDYHQSMWSERSLRGYMEQAGLSDIREWKSDGLDTSCHPVSCNLEGVKPLPPAPACESKIHVNAPDAKPATIAVEDRKVRIAALLSRPRVGHNKFWDCVGSSLYPFGIALRSFEGVFWGQCMQRGMNDLVKEGFDWILSMDYDSLFSPEHVSRMFEIFGSRTDIDALAALQCRRGMLKPLLTAGAEQSVTVLGKEPFKVTSAHFGLTLIRVESLLKLKKPWFISQADKDGEWGDDRLDDDIWFWHQWRLAGNTIYVAPDVRIGHVEEMVSVYDDKLEASHVYPNVWRARNNVAFGKGWR